MIKPGAILDGKYELLGAIGEGGMGSVWRAVHVALGRPLAIKFIRQDQKTPETVARFLREARAAAAIRHRNVVDILDFGTTEDGLPYIVMELLAGQTLKERFASPLWIPPEELVRILAGALTGLELVHNAGLVHRDLKPDNVFLARDEEAGTVSKLLDFGISRSTTAASVAASTDRMTKTGSLVGTPHYMSPEQVQGAKDVDARTDVYSVGVILYEGLTGRLPYDEETLGALLVAVATTEPRPIEQIRPDLPGALVKVVRTAMARDRKDRYGSAREFRQALLLSVGALQGTGSVDVEPPERRTAVDPLLPARADVGDAAGTLVVPPGRVGLRAWHLVTGVGILALAAAGVAFAVWGGETAADSSGRPGASTPTSTAPVPPETVTVRLLDLPPDATVSVDGVQVGGPDVTLPRDGDNHAIEVTVADHEPWRTTHPAVADGEYRVRTAAAPSSPPTTAPDEDAGPTPRPRGRAARAHGRKGRGGVGAGNLIEDPGF